MFINIKTDILAAWLKARLLERNTWRAILGVSAAIGKYLTTHYPVIGLSILGSMGTIWLIIAFCAEDTSTTLGKMAAAIESAKNVPPAPAV
jgi:hypothetical protein